MRTIVNLAVNLNGEGFDATALRGAAEAIARAGFTFERVEPGDERFLAWIDHEFGGTWSGEAYAGASVVARHGDRTAGFATYDPQGLRYFWLRGSGAQPGTGVFGPFGVGRDFRGSGIGPHLLVAALASLRERGYGRALIPAVGHEKLVAYYVRNAGAAVVETFELAPRKRVRTVSLASGNGTNFQSVLDRIAAGSLPLEVAMLVSNKTGAFALERARAAGVHAVAFPWDRAARSRAQYDAALLELVRREEPELVLLLGWMHLLDASFFMAFPSCINIHPAYLPLDQVRETVVFPDGEVTAAFRGAHAVRDALAAGAGWVGATSHVVTLEADRGPVLVRKPLRVEANRSADGIMERLRPLEHEVLAGGILRRLFER